MSVSIFYEAKRPNPLSPDEKNKVDRVVNEFSVDELILKFVATGRGLNWEAFDFSDIPYEPGMIFSGATKLPDNTKDALWTGIQHWCDALSEIRRIIPDAAWQVAVEDNEIPWDTAKQAYDPSPQFHSAQQP